MHLFLWIIYCRPSPASPFALPAVSVGKVPLCWILPLLRPYLMFCPILAWPMLFFCPYASCIHRVASPKVFEWWARIPEKTVVVILLLQLTILEDNFEARSMILKSETITRLTSAMVVSLKAVLLHTRRGSIRASATGYWVPHLPFWFMGRLHINVRS